MKWIFKLLLTTVTLGTAFAAETALCIRVAVIDFQSIGDDPNIGRAVTEIIRTELVKTGKYKVVERALLDKILEEQKLQVSGLVDPDEAVEIGKMLRADLILSGSVAKIDRSYIINARFIEVRTGTVKKAGAIRGYSREELIDMSIRLIKFLEEEIIIPIIRVGPRSYISFSFGGATFSMKELNDAIEQVNTLYVGNVGSIDGGLNVEVSYGRMITENLGLGLALGYLKGSTSGKLYGTDLWGNLIQMSEDLEVSGVLLSLRPFFRRSLTDRVVLSLRGDVGGIKLDYSESTKPVGRTEGSGTGALFGISGSGQFLTQSFFLQADIGFRSARGDVELETGFVTTELELDFSGLYLLLTGGFRF